MTKKLIITDLLVYLSVVGAAVIQSDKYTSIKCQKLKTLTKVAVLLVYSYGVKIEEVISL